MFGFGKKKKKKDEENLEPEENKKKRTNTDKIIMGAILGVAIGSVVSISLAPKKGKDKKRKPFGLFRKKKEEDEKKAALAKKLKKIPNEQE